MHFKSRGCIAGGPDWHRAGFGSDHAEGPSSVHEIVHAADANESRSRLPCQRSLPTGLLWSGSRRRNPVAERANSRSGLLSEARADDARGCRRQHQTACHKRARWTQGRGAVRCAGRRRWGPGSCLTSSVIPRESGGSSAPRHHGSIADVSGIPVRPSSRSTTAVETDELLCKGMFLPSLPPCRWRRADHPAERAIECRIGVISNASSDLGHAKGTVLQQVLGQMHPPAREILDRQLADQFDKAFCERRTRNSDFLCKRFDCPWPVWLRMKQS